MSAFYGQVFGNADTSASRRGYTDIRVSAQSWNGSLITRLYYIQDVLHVDLYASSGSDSSGHTVFSGTFEELLERLKKDCPEDSPKEI